LKSYSEKKDLGQFFTNIDISEFMASLIHIKKNNKLNHTFNILDAGAGAGILSAAAAIKCHSLDIKSIHVEAYEIDAGAIKILKRTYRLVEEFFAENGGSFTFNIVSSDFVITRPDEKMGEPIFDLSVINPPYFQYNVKDSPYSKATSNLFKGDPNIYASFMAVTLECLKQNGQLIVIVPRSFTNGLYFKGFRNYLLSKANLGRIHIFKKRNEVFKNVDVLQENIICSFIKGKQGKNITISSSDSMSDIHNI
jgi:adenine-specific DNA-methyltransferase